MYYPTQAVPVPEPPARSHDPLAVAVANASLLSVGYLMLRRRKLAVFTGLVTIVLVVLLATVVREVWFEFAVLAWWVALIVHGWFAAGGRTRRVVVRRQRLVALAVTLPVLLVFGLLRFDAAGIERAVTAARDNGDCARATTALDRVWLGHRVADAPLTARGDKTVVACQRLQEAKGELATALTGDIDELKAGYAGLGSVLAELPGHEKMVDVVLDGFLSGLPTKDACQTAAVTDWLRLRHTSDNALDRSDDVVARTGPTAIVGCGDDLMASKAWEQARTRYQQLLDQYPDAQLVAKAKDGIKKATLALELANVRSLLPGSTATQPEYCSEPAQYSGAAPYGKGTNRALMYGNDSYTARLPGDWRTTDAANAVLVVCVGHETSGTAVQTCPYEDKALPQFPREVTFHKISIPVKAYELRTGKLVVDTTLEVGGSSCPKVLSYTTYVSDFGPPGDVNVTPSDDDVRTAFGSVITP